MSTKFRTAVFIQDACLEHTFIRSRDTSAIVERPERVRAVKLGLCAAIARLEEHSLSASSDAAPLGEPENSNALAPNTPAPIALKPDAPLASTGDSAADDLVNALSNMNLSVSAAPRQSTLLPTSPAIPVVMSSARAPLLSSPAIKHIHGDIGPDGDVYLNTITKWARESSEKIANGGSEIPEGFNQGDLYLCPQSINAMEGAVGTVCEAVDVVVASSKTGTASPIPGMNASRAFVAVRPPGHHCGEDTPSGFCFINNVAVAAAHAHLQHGIKNAIILDIDLHHGNGTQSIIWQINEETYRAKLEDEVGAPDPKPGLQVYYGSIHDVLSYPCEDGKPALVQAASVALHGPHGQWIENVHLQPYTSEAQFWDELYNGPYSRILTKAEDFLKVTGGTPEDTLVFISCGFDACEHEYESMSRHGRKVPVGFYERFARDACAFAERYAGGKLVSVLEGGYSDLALISGSFAHLIGLAGSAEISSEDKTQWWSPDALAKIEKGLKKRKGGKQSITPSETWLLRATALFAEMDTPLPVSPAVRSASPLLPSSMTLRERKPKADMRTSNSANASPKSVKAIRKNGAEEVPKTQVEVPSLAVPLLVDDAQVSSEVGHGQSASVRKLPKVILRVSQPAP